MPERPDISIVIPLYNEVESIGELCSWIDRVLGREQLRYEIILVDDGSTDGSWEEIRRIASEDGLLKALRFNRNFGKSAALNTGFQYASGEVVITMDADMQDSPEEIPELYDLIVRDQYDLVSGWKKKRRDPLGKRLPSRFFNLVTRAISGIPIHDFNCGLKAYRSSVVKSIHVYGEMHRYIPLIAKWQGFNRIGEKPVEHYPRKYGSTKYGFERFIKGFLDLLSVTFVMRFRRAPMHFFGSLGTISFLAGFIITAYLILSKVRSIYLHLPYRDVVDQPLFYLALVAILIGVQLFLAGFLAELYTMSSERESNYPLIDKIGF